jgi:hypothetical protein
MRLPRSITVASLLAVIILAACQPIVVEPATMNDADTTMNDAGTTIDVVANDEGITSSVLADSELSGGITTFNFTNDRADGDFGPTIARLNDGVTLDALLEAATSEDSMSAMPLITLYGSSWLQPGNSITYETYLIPGNYVLLKQESTSIDDVIPFAVAEDDTATAELPNADIDLSLQDFAFVLPDTIAAGDNVWRITNDGEQWHEVTVIPVPDGSTSTDILNLIHDENNDEEPEVTFQFGPISSGIEVWTSLDLTPGTYVALCFLPDVEGDYTAHFDKGMIRVFEVE